MLKSMGKLLVVSAAVAFVLLVLVACSTKAPRAADPAPASVAAVYRKLPPSEAKALLASTSDAVLVDVRTEGEHVRQRIPGSILVPNESIVGTPPAKLPDLDATIIVYCRSGARSRQAAQKLIAMGYANVFDMGGIRDWPYETVGDGV